METTDIDAAQRAPTRRRSRPNTTEVLEKDETELRLEKALFGDEAGFLESLSAARYGQGKELQLYDGGSEDDASSAAEEDLAGLADEDLFFVDDGTGVAPASRPQDDQHIGTVPSAQSSRAVWYDSDDDRLTVSLANNTRLRKLRDTEDDDVISGREHIQRLRRQYERLHPPPEWLDYARKKRKTSNGASGADSDSDVSMDEEDATPTTKPLSDLLRSLNPLTRATNTTNQGTRKRRKLRPEVIDIQRTKDVVRSGPSSIDTLQFHPHYPLLLAAGPSQTITLYHISPQPPNPNPILTSLHLHKTPLHTAAFCTPISATTSTTTDATRIFLSSRRRYFHTWALSTGTITKITRPLTTIKHDQKTTENFKLSPCGRYMGLISSGRKDGGSINVLSTTTSQILTSCRADAAGGISDFDWCSDGNGFAVVGKNGEVSEFSMVEKRTIARWHDEGSVGTTVLSIGGPNSRWIAIGSSSGIVNIYDRHSPAFIKILNPVSTDINGTDYPAPAQTARPKPLKTLDHLTTPVSTLNFSADGQLLVLSSRWKKDALKLVHLPSCTVYKNWPTERTPLGRVASVALGGLGDDGEGREWLAVGNETGVVRLWEIRS